MLGRGLLRPRALTAGLCRTGRCCRIEPKRQGTMQCCNGCLGFAASLTSMPRIWTLAIRIFAGILCCCRRSFVIGLAHARTSTSARLVVLGAMRALPRPCDTCLPVSPFTCVVTRVRDARCARVLRTERGARFAKPASFECRAKASRNSSPPMAGACRST